MDKIELLASLKKHGFPKKVLDSFEKVKRENFVPERLVHMAYEDIALPIGSPGNQSTISQPYTIAEMLSLLDLKKGNKVLEIGSGSGYVLALINEITQEKTYGIEIIKELAEKSTKTLKNNNQITVFNKNGSEGLDEFAPYDRIIISATLNQIPQAVTNQLKETGILVAPINKNYNHTLTSFRKINGNLTLQKELPGFAFVLFVE